MFNFLQATNTQISTCAQTSCTNHRKLEQKSQILRQTKITRISPLLWNSRAETAELIQNWTAKRRFWDSFDVWGASRGAKSCGVFLRKGRINCIPLWRMQSSQPIRIYEYRQATGDRRPVASRNLSARYGWRKGQLERKEEKATKRSDAFPFDDGSARLLFRLFSFFSRFFFGVWKRRLWQLIKPDSSQ